MKMILLLFIIVILLAIPVVAENCITDGGCITKCINNTIDSFDEDCGISESQWYGKNEKIGRASCSERV